MQNNLETQRTLLKQRRFLAMPLAGMLVWSIINIIAPSIFELVKVYSVWLSCGSIFYLAIGLEKFTGEECFGKNRLKKHL